MKINDIFDPIIKLIDESIWIIIGFALIFFLFGVLKYAFSKDEKTRNESKSIIIYGIIGLFAMTMVWGLVNLLSDTFGLPKNTPQEKSIRPANLILKK